MDKKAFGYESGQFICHVYAEIQPTQLQDLEEAIQAIQDEQNSPSLEPNLAAALAGWKSICNSEDDDGPEASSAGHNRGTSNRLHVTLLRGHRAVYYHQIRALIAAIENECKTLKPFSLCLDKFEIFHNYERTKQFLCLISQRTPNELNCLKRALTQVINQFAIKLTEEDESPDTLAHCSLMTRPRAPSLPVREGTLEETINLLCQVCSSRLNDDLICLTRIDAINIKIGNHIYRLDLRGSV